MVYMKSIIALFMQLGLKMEAGDCPPLNMNAMQNISVKTPLNSRLSHILVAFIILCLGFTRLEITVLLLNEDTFYNRSDTLHVNPELAHIDYQQVLTSHCNIYPEFRGNPSASHVRFPA